MAASPPDTHAADTTASSADDTVHGDSAETARTFVFDVDDVTHEHDRPRITGAEIMAMAGISPSEGLIQVLADGSRRAVRPDDVVRLVPGIQFKRRPRFKRG